MVRQFEETFMYTQETRTAILQRDLEEKAGMGGVNSCTGVKVRGEKTGRVWPAREAFYDPITKRWFGPYKQTESRNWFCDMTYANGAVCTVGPTFR